MNKKMCCNIRITTKGMKTLNQILNYFSFDGSTEYGNNFYRFEAVVSI